MSQWVHPRLWASNLLEGFRAPKGPHYESSSPTSRSRGASGCRTGPQFWACDVASATGWLHLPLRRSSTPYTVDTFDSCNLARPIVCRKDPTSIWQQPRCCNNKRRAFNELSTATRNATMLPGGAAIPMRWINCRCIFPGYFQWDPRPY